MKVRIYFPWSNLGCFGFRFGRLYFDFFRTPSWGMFINTGADKIHIWLRRPWAIKRESRG